MRRLLLLPALAIAFLSLASCANNSNANSLGNATAASSSSTPSSASSGIDGEGSLAYTVNGTRIVVKRPASSLYLNEVSHDATKGTAKIKVTIFPAGDLFNFSVADKGTTNIVHYKPSFGEEKTTGTYMTASHNYYADQVVFTLTALDAAHAAGTFSGTFTAEGKTFTITEGSFDLPMHADK